MADPGNPFATSAPAMTMNPVPAGAGNPFDPLGTPSAASNASGGQQFMAPSPSAMTQQQPPPGGQNFGMSSPTGSAQGHMNGGSNFGQPQQQYSPAQHQFAQAPMPPTQQSQQPVQQQMQQQMQPSQAPPQPGAGGFDPFAPTPAPAPSQPPPSQSNALVVSSQPSNPYGGLVSPAGASMATPTSQGSAYGAQTTVQDPFGAPQGVSATSIGSGTMGFDPMAQQPPPPAAAPPPPTMAQDNSLVPVAPGESFAPVVAPSSNPHTAVAPPPAAPAPVPYESQVPRTEEPPPQQQQPSHSTALTTTTSRAIQPHQSSPQSRNRYSQELSRRAPPGASPLPKAELVRKSGYVLSRISFRTIVMKKWKQSFWVQYGSHTMLWFRAQSDFDDWLNNPYHTQGQRNFLIKLAVNFVHDLYKPNVRGYQVTQCRQKPYGNRVVRQFKLERWMDYGPTIAAAFGSYNPKEVDALREAIVECMRNTPLDGGIRATGAVRQQEPQQENGFAGHRSDSEPRYQTENGQGQYQNGHPPASLSKQVSDGQTYQRNPNEEKVTRSVASADDLLDDYRGFDDTASYPGAASSAMVPMVNPSNAYPGAPPVGAPPQQYPPQQQPYAAAPPPQAAYPTQQQFQQQQQPYGMPQQQPGMYQQQYPGQQQPIQQQHF